LSPDQAEADEPTGTPAASEPSAAASGKAASTSARKTAASRSRKAASTSQGAAGRGTGSTRRTAAKGTASSTRRGTSGSGTAKSRAGGTRTPRARSASAKSAAVADSAAASSTSAAGGQRGSSPTKARKPRFLKTARKAGADDLKRIKGVGPKLETTLNELGIYHYDQIAKWTPEHVMWVDDHLKFKGRIARDGWVDQSQTLAAGGETEFSKRADKAAGKT